MAIYEYPTVQPPGGKAHLYLGPTTTCGLVIRPDWGHGKVVFRHEVTCARCRQVAFLSSKRRLPGQPLPYLRRDLTAEEARRAEERAMTASRLEQMEAMRARRAGRLQALLGRAGTNQPDRRN